MYKKHIEIRIKFWYKRVEIIKPNLFCVRKFRIFICYIIQIISRRCLSHLFLYFKGDILRCVKLTGTNMARPKKCEQIYIVATYKFRGKTSPTRIQCVQLRLIEPVRYAFLVFIDRFDAIQPIARFRRTTQFFEYLPRKVTTWNENSAFQIMARRKLEHSSKWKSNMLSGRVIYWVK